MTRTVRTEEWLQAHQAKIRAGRGWSVVKPSLKAPQKPVLSPQRSKMNKTETRYAQYLELQKRGGAILWYKFEGIRLKLANGAWFKPDFAVLHCNGTLEFREIKGYWREAARVRIKVAADLYPFKFVAIKDDGGMWQVEKF